MPVIVPRLNARNTVPELRHGEEAPSIATGSSAAWIVAGVVGGIIIVGAVVGAIAICYAKRCEYQKAREREPYLTRAEFMRRRKMSAADLFREEEERRSYIIRKSLASRSTNSIGSRLSATADQIDQELMELERSESSRLRDDWKRWEARERHERSASASQHPVAASESGVPILSIPTPAKHRSQGPTMSLPPCVPLPPAYHPGRRSPS